MQKLKQTWDTRAWVVGVVGGGISAICYVASVSVWVSAKLHLSFPNNNNARTQTFAILCFLLLPALVSGIARRRYFLWGLAPLFLCQVIAALGTKLEQGLVFGAGYFWHTQLILAGFWFASSGPVSLFRWLRVRAKQGKNARLALIAAQQQAASMPQEGVWPPPPEYRA